MKRFKKSFTLLFCLLALCCFLSITAFADGYDIRLDVPLLPQQASNTCGDASARMCIAYYYQHGMKTGKSTDVPTESQIVKEYGTANPQIITNGIHDYCGISYTQRVKNNYTLSEFQNVIYNSISHGKPVVLDVYIGYDNVDKLGYTTDGHFLVVSGIVKWKNSTGENNVDLVINDPWHANGAGIGQQKIVNSIHMYGLSNWFYEPDGTGIPTAPSHTLNLDGFLDGQLSSDLGAYGSADIFINGSLDEANVTDYNKVWPEGTTYEIRCRTYEGYVYKGVYSGGNSANGTIGNSDVNVILSYSTDPNYHILNFDGLLDGQLSSDLGAYGSADIFINGSLDEANVTDYNKVWPEGTTYEIRCRTNEGYIYNGVYSGGNSANGAIGNSDVNVILSYSTRRNHAINLDGFLDGQLSSDLGAYGSADIFINGSLDEANVTDYNKAWPEGTIYEIRCRTNEGYIYNGVYSGGDSADGIIGNSDVNVILSYSTNTSLHKLNLDGFLDGQLCSDLGAYGSADIFINGSLDESYATDYYKVWPEGTTYEIRCRTNEGYIYNGVYSGGDSADGIIGNSDINVVLSYSTDENYEPPDNRNVLLQVNWNNIRKVGQQSVSGPCSSYALAYCRTLLDNTIHQWYEYNENGYVEQIPANYKLFSTNWSLGHYQPVYPAAGREQFVYQVIYNNLCAGRPVVVKVTGPNGPYHWVAVVGAENIPDSGNLSPNNFLIIDPSPATSFNLVNMGGVGYQLLLEDGVYAVVEPDSNSTGTVPIVPTDAVPPKINDVHVYNISGTSYTVSAVVTDNGIVKEVKMPSWAVGASTEGIDWPLATANDNSYRYTVTRNPGQYWETDIYAFDMAGNASMKKVLVRDCVLTFDARGGSVGETSRIVFSVLIDYVEQTCYGELPTPKWLGHTFEGWYSEPSGGERITAYSNVSHVDAKTLYARWSWSADTIIIPAGTKVIEAESFYGINAEYVYIPAGVEEIRSMAFADCPNLKAVCFENGDIAVADNFLSGCKNTLIIDAPEGSIIANNINTYRQYLSATSY